jgi:hypothetical protein
MYAQLSSSLVCRGSDCPLLVPVVSLLNRVQSQHSCLIDSWKSFLLERGPEGSSQPNASPGREMGVAGGCSCDDVATKPSSEGREEAFAGPGWRERTTRKGENPTPQASAEGTV